MPDIEGKVREVVEIREQVEDLADKALDLDGDIDMIARDAREAAWEANSADGDEPAVDRALRLARRTHKRASKAVERLEKAGEKPPEGTDDKPDRSHWFYRRR